MPILKDLNLKGNICQKRLLILMSSSIEKNFYDRAIGSDIK